MKIFYGKFDNCPTDTVVVVKKSVFSVVANTKVGLNNSFFGSVTVVVVVVVVVEVVVVVVVVDVVVVVVVVVVGMNVRRYSDLSTELQSS